MLVLALHLDPLSEFRGLRNVAVTMNCLVLLKFLVTLSPFSRRKGAVKMSQDEINNSIGAARAISSTYQRASLSACTTSQTKPMLVRTFMRSSVRRSAPSCDCHRRVSSPISCFCRDKYCARCDATHLPESQREKFSAWTNTMEIRIKGHERT